MKKIVEYSVALGHGNTAATQIEKDADTLIAKGFIPVGSLAIYVAENGILTLGQSFVRYAE